MILDNFTPHPKTKPLPPRAPSLFLLLPTLLTDLHFQSPTIGLSIHKLISSVLSLHHPSQGALLILSSTPSQKISIQNKTVSPISEITSDLTSHHRLSLYSSGKISFITARILIIDPLSHPQLCLSPQALISSQIKPKS